jgi:hypothetical protein
LRIPYPLITTAGTLGLLCITSCKFRMSFACTNKVTPADLLKMNFWPTRGTPEKHATHRFFGPCATAHPAVAPLADRDLLNTAAHTLPYFDKRLDVTFPDPRVTFIEIAIFNFGVFR